MSPRLFLDLDGVMYDFDTHFENEFGAKPPNKEHGVLNETMWELIHNHPGFYNSMPLFDGALSFFRDLKDIGYKPIILTACSKSFYQKCADEKREAVRRDLGDECLFLPVPGSSSKQYFVQQPGDRLIDDYPKNCLEWEKVGGVSIQHLGEYEKTLDILRGLSLKV